MTAQMSVRAQHVLKVLVEKYIHDGQPVGSRTLSESSDLVLSSASIRNVMADLEARGLVASPHTSAGRIPTDQGYRLFVDSLLSVQPLHRGLVANIQEGLRGEMSSDELVESASRMLSELSRQAGLVMLPRRDTVTLRQLEFLPLSEGRVLAILVCNEQEVQNRIMQVGDDVGEDDLRHAANYINAHYSGLPLGDIQHALVRALQQDKDSISQLLQSAVDMASQVFSPDNSDYVVAGESHLLSESDTRDMSGLRELFKAFEEKQGILDVLERCMKGEGARVFIGEESGFEALGDYSVVTTPYQVSGQTVGVLGVIGPTRMAYEQVIPLVDVTAKLLSTALNRI
jgi:heat-inducible transcriptional repressor